MFLFDPEMNADEIRNGRVIIALFGKKNTSASIPSGKRSMVDFLECLELIHSWEMKNKEGAIEYICYLTDRGQELRIKYLRHQNALAWRCIIQVIGWVIDRISIINW